MLRGTRNPAARRAAKLAFGLRPPAVPNRARLHWAALVHAGASFTRPSRKPATNDKMSLRTYSWEYQTATLPAALPTIPPRALSVQCALPLVRAHSKLSSE